MTLSEFNTYLKTKESSELLDLDERRIDSAKDVNHLPCWTDSTLLSKTKSYRVSRNYKLPAEIETIAHKSNVTYRNC
jgi:hypothetical protein